MEPTSQPNFSLSDLSRSVTTHTSTNDSLTTAIPTLSTLPVTDSTSYQNLYPMGQSTGQDPRTANSASAMTTGANALLQVSTLEESVNLVGDPSNLASINMDEELDRIMGSIQNTIDTDAIDMDVDIDQLLKNTLGTGIITPSFPATSSAEPIETSISLGSESSAGSMQPSASAGSVLTDSSLGLSSQSTASLLSLFSSAETASITSALGFNPLGPDITGSELFQPESHQKSAVPVPESTPTALNAVNPVQPTPTIPWSNPMLPSEVALRHATEMARQQMKGTPGLVPNITPPPPNPSAAALAAARRMASAVALNQQRKPRVPPAAVNMSTLNNSQPGGVIMSSLGNLTTSTIGNTQPIPSSAPGFSNLPNLSSGANPSMVASFVDKLSGNAFLSNVMEHLPPEKRQQLVHLFVSLNQGRLNQEQFIKSVHGLLGPRLPELLATWRKKETTGNGNGASAVSATTSQGPARPLQTVVVEVEHPPRPTAPWVKSGGAPGSRGKTIETHRKRSLADSNVVSDSDASPNVAGPSKKETGITAKGTQGKAGGGKGRNKAQENAADTPSRESTPMDTGSEVATPTPGASKGRGRGATSSKKQKTSHHRSRAGSVDVGTNPNGSKAAVETPTSTAPATEVGGKSGPSNPPPEKTDFDPISDVMGYAGVDLREESEGLFLDHQRRLTTGTRPGGDGGAGGEGGEGVDRSKQQAFLDLRPLRHTVETIMNKFHLSQVDDDTLNYLALATEDRLRTLVEQMVQASKHRTRSHNLAPPTLDEQGHPLYQIAVHQDVRKQLMALERVDKEQERQWKLHVLGREQRMHGPTEEAIAGDAARSQATVPMSRTASGAAPSGDSPLAAKVTKRRRREPASAVSGVLARSMSEDIRNKITNQTALLSVGAVRRSWMMSGNSDASPATPSPAERMLSTGNLTKTPTVKQETTEDNTPSPSKTVKEEPMEPDVVTPLKISSPTNGGTGPQSMEVDDVKASPTACALPMGRSISLTPATLHTKPQQGEDSVPASLAPESNIMRTTEARRNSTGPETPVRQPTKTRTPVVPLCTLKGTAAGRLASRSTERKPLIRRPIRTGLGGLTPSSLRPRFSQHAGKSSASPFAPSSATSPHVPGLVTVRDAFFCLEQERAGYGAQGGGNPMGGSCGEKMMLKLYNKYLAD
ncbi:hypothetical protein IWQ61_004118 [Dispira simplex]|nr:hypothetical protein IWQ61_004118 [Dispira simplex]